MLEYYAAQCSAGNYGAREAACVGIAELAMRIDGVAVRPHAQRMLAALLPALSDSAWPVRDAVRCVRACVCVCVFVRVRECVRARVATAHGQVVRCNRLRMRVPHASESTNGHAVLRLL